jgi:hypothetical protein
MIETRHARVIVSCDDKKQGFKFHSRRTRESFIRISQLQCFSLREKKHKRAMLPLSPTPQPCTSKSQSQFTRSQRQVRNLQNPRVRPAKRPRHPQDLDGASHVFSTTPPLEPKPEPEPEPVTAWRTCHEITHQNPIPVPIRSFPNPRTPTLCFPFSF